MNKHMHEQRGAVSTSAIVWIVVVILILIALVYWYSAGGPGASQTSGEASTTMTGENAGASSVTTNPSGDKEYSNFSYGYAVAFPPDAQNNLSNAADANFSFSSGTSTPPATLQIAAGTDVTHIAYCLTVPQGATDAATTTVNGVDFLSYNVGGTSINSGTTYYRILHSSPAGNTCFDIQKTPQGSGDLNGELNGILQSFTFITSS